MEAGVRVVLSPEDSRHALRSLRLRPGDDVTLSDDDGLLASGRLVGEEDGRAAVEVESTQRVVRRGLVVSVAFSPPKGDRFAWSIQKLAELGVDEVMPVRTSRSVREWNGERWSRVAPRLRTVAREAAMQSRQAFVTRLLDPQPLEEAVQVRGATVVVLDPGGSERLRERLPEGATAVRLVVGPEGGFEPSELDRAVELGATVAGLGEQILRTETAAVVGAALVLHRYGRLG
jgi:16S rRNA (uracil1498-N3)-methyltransferase